MAFPLHDPLDEVLRERLGAYDDLTAALLSRRGIDSPEAAEAFLAPSYDAHIHDPMLMADMPKAAERLARAIADGERVAVWSDYDCDGIPGGVLMHDFLAKAGANFTNYVPHRHNEGYGVNKAGLEKLQKDGVTLVVTVDSGIVDTEAVAHANALDMEVIVTDHHLPGDALPPAYAILNPNARADEPYPYKGLCGAGVAWKLACATLAHGFPGRDAIPAGWEKWLLDMAGLATIADMVALTGENRVIAAYGLLVMRKSPRIGLQKLCKIARVDQRRITEDDVGFMIAPRVNAASRMGDPADAFRLLATTDEPEADRLAKELEALNRSRRASAGAITRTVRERVLARKLDGKLPPVIAMGDPDWRPGLLGLVANGIAEEFGRPVFLWGREGDGANKGSCRSGPGGPSVVELMRAAAGDTFAGFGGHRASGGFTAAPHAVPDLEERLCAALGALEAAAAEEPVRADFALAPEGVTKDALRRFARFAPFGMGNPKPLVAIPEARVERVAWFGKGEEHLRVTLARGHAEFPDAPLEAIAFYARRQLGNACDGLATGGTVRMLVHLEEDTFSRGQPVRLRIVALAPS